MSVDLSDYEVLRQAVESTEPKEVFLKTLNARKNHEKRNIINFMGIDVKKCNPIYMHKHFKFKRKLYKENLFMYIDKDFKIIGFTKGSEWNSESLYVEDYSKSSNKHYVSYNSTVKTRLAMWNRAFHILMFKQSDLYKIHIHCFHARNVRGKSWISEMRSIECRELKSTLNNRLLTYKDNKYSFIEHKQLVSMVGELVGFLSTQLLEPTDVCKQMVKDIISGIYYNSTVERAIIRIINHLENTENHFSKLCSDDFYESIEKRKDYLLHKLKFIKWYKMVFGEVRKKG